MKKKQLKEYMDAYRATVHSSPDIDLRKRQDGAVEPVVQTAKRPIPRRRMFWSMVASVVVLAIVLPVAIVLGTKSNNNTANSARRYYANDYEVIYCEIASIDGFNKDYHKNVLIPQITAKEILCDEIRLIEENKIIGITARLSVYDGKYHYIAMSAYVDNYVVEEVEQQNYTATYTDGDITVEYALVTDEGYCYYLQFEYQGTLYQAAISCYAEMDIAEIMADCFGL